MLQVVGITWAQLVVVASTEAAPGVPVTTPAMEPVGGVNVLLPEGETNSGVA